MSNYRIHWTGDGRGRYALLFLICLAIGLLIPLFIAQNYVRYVALLAGGSLIIVALLKPYWGMWALFAVLPWIYFAKRFEFWIYRDLSSEFNNPVSLIPELIILTLLIGVGLDSVRHGRIRLRKDMLSLIIFGWMMFTLLQVLNPRSSLSVGLYGFRTFGFYILVYFLTAMIIRTPSRAVGLLRFMTLIAVVVAAYGIVQQVTGVPEWDRVWFESRFPDSPLSWIAGYKLDSWLELRKFSTLQAPAATSGFYVITLILAFTLYYVNRKLRWLLAAGIIGIGLALTYVRAGWLSAGLGILLLITLQRVDSRGLTNRKLFKTRVLLLMGIGLFVVFLLFNLSSPLTSALPWGIERRISSLVNPLDAGSMVARFRMWDEAFTVFRANPLGIGTGATGGASYRFGTATTVDSMFLKVMVEQGVIGITLFILFCIILLKTAWQTYRRADIRNQRILLCGIFSIIVATIVNSTVAPTLEYSVVAIHFWFLVGLLPIFTYYQAPD